MLRIVKKYKMKIFLIGMLLSIGICQISLAAASSINISPQVIPAISTGEEFTVDISIEPDGSEIVGAQYDLTFNNDVLEAVDQAKGTFLSQDGADTIEVINEINNNNGKIEYGKIRIGEIDEIGGISDPGILTSITFKVIGTGGSALVLDNVILSNLTIQPISNIEINDGVYGTSENPCEEYDTNGTPGIQKDEAVAAINEYLLYQAIDKQTAVTVLNCYFGV